MPKVTMKLNKSIDEWIRRGISDYAKKLRSTHRKAGLLIKEEIAKLAPGHLSEIIRNLPVTKTESGKGVGVFKGVGKSVSIMLEVKRKKDMTVVWVNDGTGIYGPHHTPIVPVRANKLAFKAYGRFIIVESVEGQEGQKFIERGVANAQGKVRKLYENIG